METWDSLKFDRVGTHEGVWKTFEVESTRFQKKDFSRYMDYMESELKGYYRRVKELAWSMSLAVEITVTVLRDNRPSFPFENEVFVDTRMSENDFRSLVTERLFARNVMAVESSGRATRYSRWMMKVLDACSGIEDCALHFTICRFRENNFTSPTKWLNEFGLLSGACQHGLRPQNLNIEISSHKEMEKNKIEGVAKIDLLLSSDEEMSDSLSAGSGEGAVDDL
jgi:hypothetical protein